MHFRGKGAVGLPLAGRTRSAFFQHLVYLLEGQALGLGHEEVGEEEGQAAQAAPQKEDVGSEAGRVRAVGNQVGCDDADDAVPEPWKRKQCQRLQAGR